MNQTPTVDATTAEVTVVVQHEIPPLPPVTPDMVEAVKPDGTPVVAAPVTFWGFLLGVVNTVVGLAVLVALVAFLGAGALILGAVALVAWLVLTTIDAVKNARWKAEFKKRRGMSFEDYCKAHGRVPRHF